MSNITKLNLLNVPLEADYKHTLYFNLRAYQEDYFLSTVVERFSFNDFSYQRKDNTIRIPKQYDELCGKVNYVMYQNTAYSNKWFYAFIIDMKYINDGLTEITIKTDVIQTWLKDYDLKSCFVEREHTDNDTPGANTLPEGLETGEYICNNKIEDKSMEDTIFIIGTTVSLTSGQDTGLHHYNGVITGWDYYAFNTVSEVEDVLDDIATMRTNDSIVSIFVMPKIYAGYSESAGCLLEGDIPPYAYFGWNIGINDEADDSINREVVEKPTTVNGYTPKNKKLLTYPYTYLLMDNNSGATAVYKYELFSNNDPLTPNVCDFIIYGAITPGGSIRMIPLCYNGIEGENNQYGLPGGKFPVCGWQSDYYTNWLTQNSLNLEVQTESINLNREQSTVNGIGSAIGGALSLDFDTMASSAVNTFYANAQSLNQIKGITAQKEMHAFQSPTVSGNINCGDVNFVTGNIRFTAYQMSVKEEYAKIIDNFFSMYGYQTNRVKIPNKSHRERYWYTKTVGCDISGAIPNEDMQIIKSCYDNGITFWTNPSEVGMYVDRYTNELLDNEIV